MNAPDTISQQIAEQYDRRPYTSHAFFYTSPGHLRAAAHLYGVDAVPVARARVLELGCAAGGNLLPFALAYPEARATGVDLSSVQIQQGQQIVQDLGIKNLDLRAMSLTDIDKGFGEFDYIIVHGVFSWVPPEVRDAILRICRENLAPTGIAYISYNSYPGWKAGDIVRDAMLLHSHGAAGDEEKLASAKAMLTLLSDGLSASNPLGPSLRAAVTQLRKQSDYYVAHEYLETFNSPCYFLEFADAAQQAGLAYVGDAEPHSEMSSAYGQNVQINHSLIALGQPKAMRQQYLDFAIGRNFRKSILVHREREAEIGISPDLARLRDLRWAGFFIQQDAPSDAPVGHCFYTNHKGRSLHTADTQIMAVARALSEAWPAAVTFDSLVAYVQTKGVLENGVNVAEQAVQNTLETLLKLNQVRYSLETDVCNNGRAGTVALTPGFVYLQGRSNHPEFGVGCFNLWHDVVHPHFTEADTFLLPFIDGSNTVAQLKIRLRNALQQSKVPGADGKMLTGQRNLDAKAQNMLDRLLGLLRRAGLLLV